MKRATRTGIKLGLLGLLVAASFQFDYELSVSGEFEVFPSHNADVRAAVDGIIDSVLVEEGQVVDEGQEVARLSSRQHRANLLKIDADLREQRANLARLHAGAGNEEIIVAKTELESAQSRVLYVQARLEEAKRLKFERLIKAENALLFAREQLQFSETNAKRAQKLKDKGILSEQRIEEVAQVVATHKAELASAEAEFRIVKADDLAEPTEDFANAQADLEEAKARINLIRAKARPEEIEAAEAAIARLQAERNFILEQLDLVVARSPIKGIVTTPKPTEKKSAFVEKGELILEVYDLTVIKAEILIPEKEIGDVAVGQIVQLKARAYPEHDFRGTVEAIAPIATEDDSGLKQRSVRVITAIQNPELLLKPGMTGNGKITCCERRIFDLITRRLVRYVRVEFWTWF
jgi:multidrug resistance efflux pump